MRNFKSSSPTFPSSKNLDTESGSSPLRLSSLLPLPLFRSLRSPLLRNSLSLRGLGLINSSRSDAKPWNAKPHFPALQCLGTESGSSRLLLPSSPSVSRPSCLFCAAFPLACIRNLGIDNAIRRSIPLLGSPTVLARLHAHSAKLAL